MTNSNRKTAAAERPAPPAARGARMANRKETTMIGTSAKQNKISAFTTQTPHWALNMFHPSLIQSPSRTFGKWPSVLSIFFGLLLCAVWVVEPKRFAISNRRGAQHPGERNQTADAAREDSNGGYRGHHQSYQPPLEPVGTEDRSNRVVDRVDHVAA